LIKSVLYRRKHLHSLKKNYNYTVDWGDGTSNNDVIGDITHATAGTYEVSIIGEFPRIYFNASTSRSKILFVQQ